MMNAYGLPTQTVYLLFDKLSVPLKHVQKNEMGTAFQRACLIGTFEEAVEILRVHFPGDLTEADIDVLKLAAKVAKPEVLGLAGQTLAEIAQSPMSAQKDKVLASQAINELYGDKDRAHDKTLTDKIILNLVG